MKNIGFILAVCLVIFSCKEDELGLYDGNDGIYFAPDMMGKYSDSTSFSFAMFMVNDTLINIPVRLYGEVTDYPRSFRVEVEEAVGEEGVDYETVPTEFVLPAGKEKANVSIQIYRHGSALNYLKIHILPNEYFTQSLPLKYQGKDTVDITRKTLYFTSKLSQPKNWSEYYFGYFSEAKYLFVNEVANIDPKVWNDKSFPSKYIYQLPLFLKNYVSAKVAKGADEALKDPDPQSTRGYMTFPDVIIPDEFPDAWPEKSGVN